MSKKIVILTIPGIGTKKPGYSESFEKDVRRFTKPFSEKLNKLYS